MIDLMQIRADYVITVGIFFLFEAL